MNHAYVWNGPLFMIQKAGICTCFFYTMKGVEQIEWNNQLDSKEGSCWTKEFLYSMVIRTVE